MWSDNDINDNERQTQYDFKLNIISKGKTDEKSQIEKFSVAHIFSFMSFAQDARKKNYNAHTHT